MKLETLKDIVSNACLIRLDKGWYIGIIDEDKRVIKYAYIGKYNDWIKRLNIGETETIKLSSEQGYSTKEIPVEDREFLDRAIARMNHVQKYRDGYIDNQLFDKLGGSDSD